MANDELTPEIIAELQALIKWSRFKVFNSKGTIL